MARDVETHRVAIETHLRVEAARRGVSVEELREAILEDVPIVWDEELLEDLQEALAWTLYELGELQTWTELLPHIPPGRRIGIGFVEGSDELFRPLFSGVLWGKKIPKNRLN